MTENQNLQAMSAQRMTSLEIAQVTGKMHKDVLKAIRNMEPAWEKTAGRKFALSEYQDSTGRTLPCYSLSKTECLYIAKAIGMETNELNSWLCDMGVQKWRRGQFRLTQDYEDLGLAQDRLFIYYSKDGKQKERTYLVWTQKGAEMIGKMLNKDRRAN